jgi:hypothetical protein
MLGMALHQGLVRSGRALLDGMPTALSGTCLNVDCPRESAFVAQAHRWCYFTQQHAPLGEQGQVSQVQPPVSQQPQTQSQTEAPLAQQPSAQAGVAWGAEGVEKSEASKNISAFIKISPVKMANSNQNGMAAGQVRERTRHPSVAHFQRHVAIKSARRSRECGAGEKGIGSPCTRCPRERGAGAPRYSRRRWPAAGNFSGRPCRVWGD